MEEERAIIDSIIREDAELNGELLDDGETGWTTVKSKPSRRNHNNSPKNSSVITPEFIRANGVSFVTVEGSSDTILSPAERRRRVLEEQRSAFEIAALSAGNSSRSSEVGYYEGKGKQVIDDSNGTEVIEVAENASDLKKTKKKKKNRLAKISVEEAVSQIDAEHLAAYLNDTSSRYESQEDMQLSRFADYFRRAFAPVSSDEFPWMKLLQESSVSKMIDIPLAHLPVTIYNTSVDWINGRSPTPVGAFVLGLWDEILAEEDNNQTTAKGGKQVVQDKASKSQVAAFMILALTLRRKPDTLINLIPVIKNSPKYLGKDMLLLTVWVITQALQGDLAVGLHMWVQVLLPMLGEKTSPHSRDLILQVLERILSLPKAQQILMSGAVRKGERLVPPSELDTLMRLTFPPPEARVKATARFEAVYPTLKCIALAKSRGKKGTKQVSEQIFNFAIKAAAVPNLSGEATDLAIWCFTVNSACYEQWEKLYLDNTQASIAILNKVAAKQKEPSANLSTDSLRKTLQNIRKKNKTALATNSPQQSSLNEADKQCKAALEKLSSGHHQWLRIMLTISVILGMVSIFLVILSRPRPEA